MKKFFLWYFIIFITLIIGLNILNDNITWKSFNMESTISAKQIFGTDKMSKKIELDENEIGDVGEINYNYALGLDDVTDKYFGGNSNNSIDINKIKEIQVFLYEADWDAKIYYYSYKKDDLEWINEYVKEKEENDEDDDEYKDYEYKKITYILNNNKKAFATIFINPEIENKIKETFQRKKITLSKNAALGTTYSYFYSDWDFTKHEKEKIIQSLNNMYPIYFDDMSKFGSAGGSDANDDIIWAYHYENKVKESYGYDMKESEELTDIIDQINAKSWKDYINNDSLIDYMNIYEYQNNSKIKEYSVSSSEESFIQYIRNHYMNIDKYPKNNYIKIIFYRNYDTYVYLKVPITEEFNKYLKEIEGEKKDEE